MTHVGEQEAALSEGPRQAATVLLVDHEGRVFWARRARRSWLGGFHAFPGGAVEPEDLVHEVAAIRETFEETGLLLVPGAERARPSELAELRRALVAKELLF